MHVQTITHANCWLHLCSFPASKDSPHSCRDGEKRANYFGSITQSTTVHIGWDGEKQVHVPFSSLLPTVHPNDLVVDGWDINGANLYEAALRAKVG